RSRERAWRSSLCARPGHRAGPDGYPSPPALPGETGHLFVTGDIHGIPAGMHSQAHIREFLCGIFAPDQRYADPRETTRGLFRELRDANASLYFPRVGSTITLTGQ